MSLNLQINKLKGIFKVNLAADVKAHREGANFNISALYIFICVYRRMSLDYPMIQSSSESLNVVLLGFGAFTEISLK